MLFNSAEFIFGFLPAVLLGFYLITRRGRTDLAIYFLAAASVFFYGWWNFDLVWLLAGSVVANYLFGRWLARWRARPLLAVGIVFNLGLLGWFKYAGFFASVANDVSGASFSLGPVILPLAISFFTFQQIAYLVDVYQGQAKERNFGRYALFVTFFPQLIAGPIVHHSEILPQYDKPSNVRLSYDNLSAGTTIFVIGLFKKVMMADPMGAYADLVFGTAAFGDPVSFVTAWAGAAAFGLEIYFDFSGYSDMAIGLARMFGIRLPLNFNSPYKAVNIIDFWRRWHMTLSRFLRDYLYIPLGGRRRGRARRYANLMTVMLLGGLWHGAAWTFVAWGALHGLYLMINHGWRALRHSLGWAGTASTPVGRILSRGLTLIAVIFAWVLFRAENWQAAEIMIRGMSGANGVFLPQSYAVLFGGLTPLLEVVGVQFGVEPDPAAYPTLSQLLEVIALFAFVLVAPSTQEWMEKWQPALGYVPGAGTRFLRPLNWRPSMATGSLTALLFLISVGTFLKGEAHEFIYFQF